MKRFDGARALFVFLAAAFVCSASLSAVSAGDLKPLTPGDIWKLKAVGEPQLSPDGKWIAYTLSTTDFEKNSRNSDIYVVASGGGEPRRMTTSEKRDDSPAWSPDGATLAFISSRGGDAQIYVLPVAGGEARKVTDFPGGVDDMIWTPDGKGFVFAARTYLGCADLDCIEKKDKEKEESKVGALVHERLMYRHWNAYEDGKVQHLWHTSAREARRATSRPALKFDALTYWLASAGRDFDAAPDGGTVYFSGKQDEDQAVSYNEEIWCVPLAGGDAGRSRRIRPPTRIRAFRPTGNGSPGGRRGAPATSRTATSSW